MENLYDLPNGHGLRAFYRVQETFNMLGLVALTT